MTHPTLQLMPDNFATMTQLPICPWPGNDPLMMAYHNQEWGTPLHEDGKLFEFLVLDAFQAGLSWKTILYRREEFRAAFDGFDAEKISRYDDKKIQELLMNPGIIRNRLKVTGTIKNAQKFLEIQEKYGGFEAFIWQFTKGKPRQHTFVHPHEVPATSRESDAMSKHLKQLGFTFVGSTICYAFMQASGMVNDHLVGCFRHKECADLALSS